jgi:hypothetical protein
MHEHSFFTLVLLCGCTLSTSEGTERTQPGQQVRRQNQEGNK